jgi:ribosome recycling factor
MSPDVYVSELKEQLVSAIVHLEGDLSQLQIGRASASIVDMIEIDSYGTKQPLRNVASISVPDAATLQIQPWDKSNLQPIETALGKSDLNLPLQNDGSVIWIRIPLPTEDRRKDLSRIVGKKVEEAKISVRNARHQCHDGFKKLKDGKSFSEDEFHTLEKLMQEQVDDCNTRIDDIGRKKETEIMTV